jgi:predicted RNase H-like nuclease (RuvC/YqgF family)
MSAKKKKVKVDRPIDAIREMIEDQCLQISDLTEIIKKQSEEIRSLKAKWRAKESLEEEAKLAKEKADSSSWFFAGRSSD